MTGQDYSLQQLQALLTGRVPAWSVPKDKIPAGVLALFSEGPSHCAPELLLTRRALHLRTHRGEIAFPGGVKEPEDGTLWDAALRELSEELGLPERAVTFWGELSPVFTGTGYVMAVFVGAVDLSPGIRPEPEEVAEVLRVTVEDLMDPATVRDESFLEPTGLRSRPTYSYNGRVVWGATARIITQLREALRSLSG